MVLKLFLIFKHSFWSIPGDESYTDVKVLLDYAQEILPLPCICAEIWLKYNVLENSFLAYLHAALGFSAFTFLVLYECKRMDLTDLTILTSGVSLATVRQSQKKIYVLITF